MRSSVFQACLRAILLSQAVYSQASPDDSNVLGFDIPLDPLRPLGIDTSTLPTYLVVASGTVPQITAGALEPIATPTAAAPSSVDVFEDTSVVNDSLTQTAQDNGARMTRITTTLLTVADGSTVATALTTTVPISIVPVTQDKGSSSISKQASNSLYTTILIVATALMR